MLLTCLILTIMMLYPFTPMQMSVWPLTVFLVLLLVVPLFGCGKVCMGRPQFQWHYHGERTVVMDEVAAEMLEQDVTEKE